MAFRMRQGFSRHQTERRRLRIGLLHVPGRVRYRDGMGIAVDAAGNAYVTSETGSQNFPTTASVFDTSKNGAFDAFVTKLNPAGSALVYSTYLGGTAVEYGSRVVLDAARNAYVMGSSSSADLPMTLGAFDTTPSASFDAFVTKLNTTGSALVYSTYLGGSGSESGGGLAVGSGGSERAGCRRFVECRAARRCCGFSRAVIQPSLACPRALQWPPERRASPSASRQQR